MLLRRDHLKQGSIADFPHYPCKNTIKHNEMCIKYNTMQRKREKTEKIIVEK